MKTIRSLFVGLVLLAAPLLCHASTGTAVVGDSVAFSVAVASGTVPFTYQWAKNGADIAGATAATYVIPAAALADAGTYTVRVSNSAGACISDNAVLTVAPPIFPPAGAVSSVLVTKKQAAAPPANSTTGPPR